MPSYRIPRLSSLTLSLDGNIGGKYLGCTNGATPCRQSEIYGLKVKQACGGWTRQRDLTEFGMCYDLSTTKIVTHIVPI